MFFIQRNYQSSANAYREAINGDGEPHWTEVWSHVQLGKIFDITGQRERAVNEYRQAAQTNDNTFGALEEARKYLQKAYETAQRTRQPVKTQLFLSLRTYVILSAGEAGAKDRTTADRGRCSRRRPDEAVSSEASPASSNHYIRQHKVPHRGFAATQNDMSRATCRPSLYSQFTPPKHSRTQLTFFRVAGSNYINTAGNFVHPGCVSLIRC